MGDSSGTAGTWRRVRAKQALDRRMQPWLARREYLRSLLAIADAGDASATARRSWLGVQCAAGEREVLSLSVVELVEASRTPQHTQGGYIELGLRAPVAFKVGTQRGVAETLPPQVATVDRGAVTITTKRVIFRGPRHTRVWELRDLVGVETHPHQPLVYFHDRKKPKTGGLRLPLQARDILLEHLEVAIAVSRGEQAAIARQLRARLRAHEAERPDALTRRPPRLASTIPFSAGLGRRLAARAVDAALYFLIFSIVMLGGTPASASSGESGAMWAALFFAAASITFLEAAFIATTTGTPGKRLLRCTVVDERTGQPPTLARALLRSTVMAVLCCTVVGALIDAAVALLEDGRSLHDQAAGTAVVRSNR